MQVSSDAAELARRIAERLAAKARNGVHTGSHGSTTRSDSSLTRGDLGVALALLYASGILEDQSYLSDARILLCRAAKSTADQPLSHPGLFSGTAGFAWVLAEFARREPRYVDSLHRLAAELSTQVQRTPLSARRTFYDYDVLTGAAGQLTCVLVLADAVAGAGGGDLAATLRLSAERLVAHLMTVTTIDDAGVPGWFVSAETYSTDDWRMGKFPDGLYDLGFAHGLSGIVAALSRAAVCGIGGEPTTTRLREIVEWLQQHTLWSEAGPSWPSLLQAEPGTRAPLYASDPPGRAAWCYGPAGVASALLPASAVIDSADAYAVAVSALERVAGAPPQERHSFSPTLCHGHAGLLAIFTRAHAQTGLPALAEARDAQVGVLSRLAADEHPYIFADEPEHGTFSHDPGFLTGAAGVLLALLGVTSAEAQRWDEVLLLAPTELGADAGGRWGGATR